MNRHSKNWDCSRDRHLLFYEKKTFGFSKEFIQCSKVSSGKRQLKLDNIILIATGSKIKLEIVKKYFATQLINLVIFKMPRD